MGKPRPAASSIEWGQPQRVMCFPSSTAVARRGLTPIRTRGRLSFGSTSFGRDLAAGDHDRIVHLGFTPDDVDQFSTSVLTEIGFLIKNVFEDQCAERGGIGEADGFAVGPA